MTLPCGVRRSLVARVLNARQGRWHDFWATEQTNVVELVEADGGFGKMIHSPADPVLRGLVGEVVHWPGAGSLPRKWA